MVAGAAVAAAGTPADATNGGVGVVAEAIGVVLKGDAVGGNVPGLGVPGFAAAVAIAEYGPACGAIAPGVGELGGAVTEVGGVDGNIE